MDPHFGQGLLRLGGVGENGEFAGIVTFGTLGGVEGRTGGRCGMEGITGGRCASRISDDFFDCVASNKLSRGRDNSIGLVAAVLTGGLSVLMFANFGELLMVRCFGDSAFLSCINAGGVVFAGSRMIPGLCSGR